MYNVLIVDDESIIVDSYYELLMDIMGDSLNIIKCISGVNALEQIGNRIDILITDINMPEINGYVLQKAVCNQWPKCKVIFLTGNQTLDFAQRAIRNGSFMDYILKTEEDTVLLNSVRTAMHLIDHEIKSEDVERNTRRNIQMALPLLRKELFESFTDGAAIDLRRLDSKFRQYGLDFTAGRPVILLMGSIGEPSLVNARSRSHNATIFFAADNIVKEYITHKYTDFGFTTRHNTFLWFLQPRNAAPALVNLDSAPDDTYRDDIAYIHSLLDIIQDQCDKHIGVQLSFTMSKTACRWDLVANLYGKFNIVYKHQADHRNAIWFLEDYLMYNDLTVLTPETQPDGFKAYESQIEHFLLTKDSPGFMKLLERLIVPYQENSHSLASLHFDICSLMMRIYNTMNIPVSDRDLLVSHLTGRSPKELKKGTMPEFYRKAIDIASGVISNEKSIDNLIEFSKEYIKSHLSSDLSLILMASLVYHSPTYFSKLFKKATGVGYCEYVVDRRINMAVELLKTTDGFVNDIALRVGYDSVPYFIKTFKRLNGDTPHEYREKLRKSRGVDGDAVWVETGSARIHIS